MSDDKLFQCLMVFGKKLHCDNKIYIIDKIQHRAARSSLCNYNRYSSVTLMQYQLNWQNLQQCWQIARLLLLYKALHNYTALHIPPYYKPSHTNTSKPPVFIYPSQCHAELTFISIVSPEYHQTLE